MHAPPAPLRAISFDLDDTLWPVWPTIRRAEAVLHAFLTEHAPKAARLVERDGYAAVRARVLQTDPRRGHDVSWLRRQMTREVLLDAGEDPALADPAFERFLAERQAVELYPDVRPTLERLARRFRLVAITNGNADPARIGLTAISATVSAEHFGIAKPDPSIFHEACRRAGAEPAEVLHVGDDPLLDYDAARLAGMPAVLVARVDLPIRPAAAQARVFADLHQLADWLGA